MGPHQNWQENPPRSITQYAVTISPRGGEAPQVVYVSAETYASYLVTGLQVETTYDIQTNAVIDTGGLDKQTYDLGISLITVDTAAPSSK